LPGSISFVRHCFRDNLFQLCGAHQEGDAKPNAVFNSNASPPGDTNAESDLSHSDANANNYRE
jgi:hypothetical protein